MPTPDKKRKKKDSAAGGAKKKRLSWVEGYQLLEQFPSSGDYKYIDEKMHNTMEPANTGHLQYSGYEILNVYKVLNSANYERYRVRRTQMNIEIAKAKALGQEGAHVEEMRLWHGSPVAEKICQEGFNLAPAKNGLFGKGLYFAEHSSKSNMYSWGVGGGCPTHRNPSCFDCTRMMLLCKVALGRQMLTPEYVNCLPTGVDTVVAKPGVIGLVYPEYIIYHQDQAYPSYLIKYKLKPPRPPKCDECSLSKKKAKKDAAAIQALPIRVAVPKSVTTYVAAGLNQCPVS